MSIDIFNCCENKEITLIQNFENQFVYLDIINNYLKLVLLNLIVIKRYTTHILISFVLLIFHS